MVDGQHRVRLTATESRLQLNHRLAASADQPLSDLGKEQPHSFGDEGAIVERRGVLVFLGRLARMHRRDIGRELGLLESSFQHIAVRNGNLSPRFHSVSSTPERKRGRRRIFESSMTAKCPIQSRRLPIVPRKVFICQNPHGYAPTG